VQGRVQAVVVVTPIYRAERLPMIPDLQLITLEQANRLIGRCIFRDGINYTVTSASTYGEVAVWNPEAHTITVFDSPETFENWAYGTPIPSAAQKGPSR
jgi:hypothetical protein